MGTKERQAEFPYIIPKEPQTLVGRSEGGLPNMPKAPKTEKTEWVRGVLCR